MGIGAMVASIVASPGARAGAIGADHAFGLGVAVGEPTSITGKFYLGSDYNALEAQVGSYYGSYGYGDNIYLHLVYLWHPSIVASGNNFEIPWHIGVGGALWQGGYCSWYHDHCYGEGNDLVAAIRVPLGLDFNLQDPRFQFFGDLALDVVVLPPLNLDFGLQIGARYYF
jgi:hypothetical protein